jgi:hypothetical protein
MHAHRTDTEEVATSLPWNAQRDCQSILAQKTQVIDSSRNPRSRGLAQSLRTTTPQGAHLLLQIRVQALNDDLQRVFELWYPGLGRKDSQPLAA